MAENKALKTTYEVNGHPVTLTDDMIRKYLTRTTNKDVKANDQEIMMFLQLCKHQKLNPFLNEAYLVKMSNDYPATIITSKDVFIKRAAKNPAYNGKKGGIVIMNSAGEKERREGCIVGSGEKILGGWCAVYRKDQEHPVTIEVDFNEYAKKKNNGDLMSTWAKMPATMIRKVAVAQALREAFPDDCAGLYVAEEMSNAITPDAPREKTKSEKEFFSEE